MMWQEVGGQTGQMIKVFVLYRGDLIYPVEPCKAYKQELDMERFALKEIHFRESEMDNMERPARKLWKNLGAN